jgi:hypothetical protein
MGIFNYFTATMSILNIEQTLPNFCVYTNFSFARRHELSVRMTARLCRPRAESFQELVFFGGERWPHFEFLRRRQHALKTTRVERDKGFEIARHGGGHMKGVQ